jgi:putative ABC transport system substrate-binding protein
MKRREFITLLGGAAMWPVAAGAQPARRMRRVGALIGGSENDPAAQRWATAFREGLANLGWKDGSNLRLDLRFAGGDLNQVRASAAELVSLAPDVMFVSSGTATRAVQQQTRTIPIVFAGPGNESISTAKNIPSPEGNTTGFPVLYSSIASKWVELLKELDPRIARVGPINNPVPTPTGIAGSGYISFIDEAAPAWV